MPSPSPRKQKPARPFLSFLKTSSSTQLRTGNLTKDLPLLPRPEPPAFTTVAPPRLPPQIPPPSAPARSGDTSRTGFRNEAGTPDHLFPPLRFGSPIATPSLTKVNQPTLPATSGSRTESPLSAATDDIGTPDNLFPPLRFGSPIDSPSRRPPLAKRPLYPPSASQRDTNTPDNLFPPLRFGSPSSSPGGHSPALQNNTPTSRLRSATLQSPSNPSGTFTTPPNRLRSATIESSANTFGSPTPPRVIARDYASPASTVTPRPLAPAVQITCPTTSPKSKHRRRPSKLTLRTTNLESQSGETTPTPQNLKGSSAYIITTPQHLTPLESHPASAVASTLRSKKARERRRSRSTGDLESLVLRQGQHRHSRSETHRLEAFPVEVDPSSDTESRRNDVYAPASMLSTLSMMSDATASPDKPSGSRFENVPLPWSTHPLSSLLSSLPRDYLSIGRDELSSRAPHILSPDTLASLTSEEDRLQLGLERLKVKHTSLSHRRGKLITRLGVQQRAGDISTVLQAVQETVGRVDRVARQIYICNDQLRQMEVMKRDHEIGVLLWALKRDRTDYQRQLEEDRLDCRMKMQRSEPAQSTTPAMIPDIQLTRATLYETTEPQDDGYEVLDSPMVEVEDPETYAEKRLSCISISSPRFGFPIPPTRPSIFPPTLVKHNDETSPTSDGDGSGHEFDDAETDCDYNSSFGDEPDRQAVNYDSLTLPNPYQITIYPPGQGTTTYPGSPDLPHTPLGSSEPHTPAKGLLPLAKPITPLSARRSRPDLTIPIPRRPSSRRPRNPTSPLRLKAVDKTKARRQSMQYTTMDKLQVGIQEKVKRERESRLENPESIMLSLATAELWTKGIYGRGTRA